MTFFEVSAQLIPLLFIALVFERRYFERADDEPVDGLDDIAIVLLFVMGEVMCLHVLAREEVYDGAVELVILPLSLATLLLVHPLLVRGFRAEWRSETHGVGRLLSRAGVVVAAGGAYLLLGGLFVIALLSLLVGIVA